MYHIVAQRIVTPLDFNIDHYALSHISLMQNIIVIRMVSAQHNPKQVAVYLWTTNSEFCGGMSKNMVVLLCRPIFSSWRLYNAVNWEQRHPKLSAIWLLFKYLMRLTTNETSQLHIIGPFWGKSSGQQHFHVMTSSLSKQLYLMFIKEVLTWNRQIESWWIANTGNIQAQC